MLALLPFASLPLVAQTPGPRPFGVSDLIGMTRLGSQPIGWAVQDHVVRSPDGSRVAVVIQRGDLSRNVVDYTLLVFHPTDLRPPRPDTVLTLASSSNRPAIAKLAWLADNTTIAFLGEHSGEASQVYSVNTGTHKLKGLTTSPTAVIAFTIAPSGDPLLYTAEAEPADTSDYPIRRAGGFVIKPTEFVGDLVAGRWNNPSAFSASRTFIKHARRAAVPVPDPGSEYVGCDAPAVSDFAAAISPNGTAALIYCAPRLIPQLWRRYGYDELRKVLFGWGWGFFFPQPMVLDLGHNRLAPLMNAPSFIYGSLAWAPDSRSVVLANAFLPLDIADTVERAAREREPALAEIDLRTHAVTVIARGDSLHVLGWDGRTNTIEVALGRYYVSPTDTRRLYYRKTPAGWTVAPSRATVQMAGPQPVIDEGMNTPPRLVVVDPQSGTQSVFFNPNPGLVAQFRIATEKLIHWQTKAGAGWVGGLYLPVDYVAGRHYPLVIQTHDFDSTRFSPEGASATGYAAQPLAAHGMLVLQMGYHALEGDLATPHEGPSAMASFEAAVDYLDSLGMIDRTNVGLMGWSRTCYHVEYTVTHSRYDFAAAMIADGVDFSYLQYLIFQPSWAAVSSEQHGPVETEAVNGGPPFGGALDTWRERAPGFNLDRLRTPLHITALGTPGSLLGEWEVYAGLLLQHKPVEMLYLPEGAHGLVKPQERLTSQQGAVDWFRFWLKGEEDPDPTKAEQYARWRELRQLQQQQQQTAHDTVAAGQGTQ